MVHRRLGSEIKGKEDDDKQSVCHSLADLQQCSALFRDFQGEFKTYQKEQALKDKEERRMQKKRENNHKWALDQANFTSQQEKDRRILGKIIKNNKMNS